ncbi:MAG: ATP-binding protein [Anaerolineales bacterium]|nr:ATP-binding protein [Anaerolineales bacterium]
MLLYYLAQAAEFVSEPPGSLAYHLVLLAIFQLTVAITLNEWRHNRGWHNARPFLAALGLLTLTAINFAVELLVAAGILNGQSLFPPLSRAASSLALLWIFWVLIAPQPSRLADGLTLALSLIVVAAGSFSGALWSQTVTLSGGPFNGSLHELIWTIAQSAVLASALLLLLARQPSDWGISALLALALLGAYAAHASAPFGDNMPGGVRLCELVVMPMFAALLYRRAFSPARTAPLKAEAALAPTVTAVSRHPDPQIAAALAALGSAANPDELAQLITVAGAQAAQGELCLLISPPDELGTSKLLAAYDLAHGQFLPSTVFSTADLPDYQQLLDQSGVVVLRPQQQADILRRLMSAVGRSQIGPTLLLPLRAGQRLVGVLATASLSTRREPPPETATLLTTLGPILAEYLSPESKLNRLWRSLEKAQTQAAAAEEARRAARLEADQLHIALESARTEAERLNNDILQLRQEMEGARSAEAVEAIRAAALAEQAAQFAAKEAEWQEKLAVLEQGHDQWRAEAEALQAQLQALQEQVEESEQQRKILISELEPLRASVQAFSAQAIELQRLQAEVERQAKAQTELDAVRKELETTKQSLAELQAQLEQARSERETAQTAAHEAQTQLEQSRKELEAMRREAAAQTDSHQQALSELQARLAAAHHELETLQQREAEHLATVQPRQTDLAERESELRATIARLTAEAENERQRFEAELRQFRERVATQEELLATWQLDYGVALEQEKRLRESLEAALANVDRQNAELAQAQAELNEARAAVATLSEQAARLAEAQAEVEQLRQQAAAAELALEETRNALRLREEELEAARQNLTVAEAEASRFAVLQSELEQLRQQLLQARTELETTQNQLTVREQELQEATGALAELSKQTQQLTELQKQLANMERELAEARALLPAPTEGAARPFLPAASLEIIASLSQELRQPMAAIVGYTELLLGESVGILGALQRKFLERIKASCERMQTLLGDLINITDIDSGTLQLTPESVDVLSVIEDAIMSCSAQFREKGINLRLDVADSLPSLSADRDALRQIVLHLLSNAGNASGVEGEVLLKVREEVSPAYNGQPGSAVLISVRDSGGGIAPADQPRVFNRFWRADAPLIAGLGETGVGLSIAKALVEAHGGRIWFTTELGKGSTFTVLLPTDRTPDSQRLSFP